MPQALVVTRNRLLLIAVTGLGAPLIYVTATAAGSLLDPSYSQLRYHVSELTASGAPTWAALAPAYVTYNLLVAALGVVLFLALRGRLFAIGAGLLATNAAAGILSVTVLRQDPGGLPTTAAGVGHLVAAGVMVLAVLAAAFLYGVAFRRSVLWRPLSRFSFGIGIGLLVVGPIGALAAGTQLAGLAERLPIGLSLLWLAGIGGFALRLTRHGLSARPSPAGP
jgi:hypothetical protein